MGERKAIIKLYLIDKKTKRYYSNIKNFYIRPPQADLPMV